MGKGTEFLIREGLIMRAIKIVIVMSLSVAAVSNSLGQVQTQIAESAIVEGNNKFAFVLYDKLREEKGNLFFSSYSISTALAMTYAGARGETQTQMAKVLCFPPIASDANQTKFHASFEQIIKGINERGGKGAYELTVANALWGQKGYKFLNEYLALIETNYGGGFNQVDFINATEEARQTINRWVEKKTNDKIKDLIGPNVLNSLTRLVLTDAIYFKGKWASQFKKEQTKNEPFTLLDGKKIDVPTMKQTKEYGYMEANDLQGLELPYVNEELSMIILLPKKIDGLSNLEEKLNYQNLSQWLTKLYKPTVVASIPRFKMTQPFRLDETLQLMGMVDAFQSGKADFSGMDGTTDLFISSVIHKAYINIDEEGTEAAAATEVEMKLSIEDNPVFKADHPFIFLIRDNKSGSILFIGRVMNPEK
jgi:serpin B